MKCEAKTEQEMREAEVERPESMGDLVNYIETLVDREHDYGTSVYAMSMAATAAFNYVADKLGVTGFQASCADMDVLRRTRHIDGPFMLIRADQMLYPQYSIERVVREALVSWGPWAAEKATKLLQDQVKHQYVAPEVLAHWRHLASAPIRQSPPAPKESTNG